MKIEFEIVSRLISFVRLISYLSFCNLVICQTINRTYQTIDRKELQLALGRLSTNEFENLIKSRGWKAAEGDANYIWIANHEENIKSRNIVEKIKFDRKLTVNTIKPMTHFRFFRCCTSDEYSIDREKIFFFYFEK